MVNDLAAPPFAELIVAIAAGQCVQTIGSANKIRGGSDRATVRIILFRHDFFAVTRAD
jgi:hypothetical protein